MHNWKKLPRRSASFDTQCVRAGEHNICSDAPVVPIWQTATFSFADYEEILRFIDGKSFKTKYGRYGNPLQKAFENKIASLEGTEGALVFASGMSALTTSVLSLVKAGDHVVYGDFLYRNTTRFFSEILPRTGVTTTCVDGNDMSKLKEYLQDNTRLAFFEIPANLFLRVADLSKISRMCKTAASKPILIVDSTFATPFCLRPTEYDVDLVIHSLTKYLGGHDDLLGGCVCGQHRLLEIICGFRDVLGGIADPHNTFLCMRSLKTFPVRMERLNRNGLEVALFLDQHKKVDRIWYPGLPSHPDHSIATKMLEGFGSVIYFTLRGNARAVQRLIENVKIPSIGTNFGGVHTLIEPFSVLTFGKVGKRDREKLGIGDGLIRLCIGLEDVSDIIGDLRQALDVT